MADNRAWSGKTPYDTPGTGHVRHRRGDRSSTRYSGMTFDQTFEIGGAESGGGRQG